MSTPYPIDEIPRFDRQFFTGTEPFTRIGHGGLGGKASGLAHLKDLVQNRFQDGFEGVDVDVPRLTVIATHFFDRLMDDNGLHGMVDTDLPDERVARQFLAGDLPAEIMGDLLALISKVHSPLAIRSSSLLEDSLDTPFAGIYSTKMIPNNQIGADTRFKRLVEAIKFVYASTFFKAARSYRQGTGLNPASEKMAVIIQEVVGDRREDRFYPDLSGVARSVNAYPFGHATPEDGVVSLAAGLGKAIVDGGLVWSYSPAYPGANPPYGRVSDLFNLSQRRFWTVNMGQPPAYDPVKETEYLMQCDLEVLETDGQLRWLASTYDGPNDRLRLGAAWPGPRILTFAPLLQMNDIPLNSLVKTLLEACQEALGGPVEIEFAMTLDPKPRFSLLQARLMGVASDEVGIDETELEGPAVLARSRSVLGSGSVDGLVDVVYVRPEAFNFSQTSRIAAELNMLNRTLQSENRPYLLIGFGRWGSSDSWLGIPVTWGQISGAKAIIEASHPDRVVDRSQGSHFFHNLAGLGVVYFSPDPTDDKAVDWAWLDAQPAHFETDHIRHVRLERPLAIRVSSRKRLGVISR